MKKSEKIRYAMLALVGGTLPPSVLLEVLEMLMEEKKTAEFVEEYREEKKNG